MFRPLIAALLTASALAAVTALPAAAQGAPAAAAAQPAPILPAADTRPLQYGRFTVQVVGKGPDVILIPGLSSSRDTFAATVEALKGRYRVHAVQIAGFAGTPSGDNATGEVVAPTVEAIDRYIQDQHLKAPAVIGHSLGGEAALMLAARHPGDVGKVMAVDSLPFLGVLFTGPAATSDSLRPMADAISQGMAKSDDAGWAKGSWNNAAPLVTAPERKAQVVGWSIASDRGVSARAFRDLIVTDLRPELARITAPATILYAHGAQYPQSPEATTAFITSLYANLKGAKLVRVEPSRHFIMFDQPARFETEVEAFLAP